MCGLEDLCPLYFNNQKEYRSEIALILYHKHNVYQHNDFNKLFYTEYNTTNKRMAKLKDLSVVNILFSHFLFSKSFGSSTNNYP